MHRIPRYQVSLVRDGSIPYDSPDYPHFRNSEAVYEHMRPILATADREIFIVIALDAKNHMIGYHPVAVGCLSSAVFHPREVFKPLILQSAAGFLALHNHPSGDPAPSREDVAITARLFRASQALGIDFLDHLVMGEGAYYSFADHGKLAELLEEDKIVLARNQQIEPCILVEDFAAERT